MLLKGAVDGFTWRSCCSGAFMLTMKRMCFKAPAIAAATAGIAASGAAKEAPKLRYTTAGAEEDEQRHKQLRLSS